MNGNSTTSRVAVRIFSFVNLTVVYLHCQVQLCIEMGSNTCTAVSTSCFGNNALSFTATELITHLTWMSLLAVMVVSHKTRMIVSPCRTVYKELLGQQRQLEELLGHLGLYWSQMKVKMLKKITSFSFTMCTFTVWALMNLELPWYRALSNS